MSIRLNLFGSPRIEFSGATTALPFERRTQLIVLLALKRAWVGRAELAAMFWPDQATKLAYTNLRKILFRMQALPYAGGLETQGSAVRFLAATDVFDFDTALRDGRIADALPLVGGELLQGFDDGQSEAWTGWLNFERDRLRAAWRSAALDRLGSEIEPGVGVELSARLLETDPLDEAALRAHMVWLSRHGQSARARQVYQGFVHRLTEELGLAPGAELKSLHESLGAAAVAAAPSAAKAAGPLDDGFVGRSIELRRLAELLAQDDCQLVSVVGPGGMGKTRLAHRASDELAPHFADGTVFVPLEGVAAPGELGSRLARALGIAAGTAPLAKVVAFLRERQMLIVLDNFEHLAAGASQLEDLLRACPRTKFIVTSRVRLAIPSEWLLRLDGLPCPEAEDEDHVEAFDAARLFIRAAHRVEPALLPAAEAAAIVEICRQVGGLPLALELAAAWTRVLSCDAIATELRRGAELLSASDGAHPARHASIEAVFDQSWRLLTPVERDVLARLSVFRGGFTAEAARAVAGAALPVLGALADKSLLRKEDARLHLHALVQQFAAARLIDEPRAVAEAAHAQCFHRLMAQIRRPVESGDRQAMQQMDTEFENCRAAWQWAVVHGATDLLTTSESGLLHYCDHRSRFDESLALTQRALDSPACQADLTLAARLWARAAHVTYRMDRYAEAEATAQRALDTARATRDPGARSLALNVLGSCCLRLGRYEDALRHFRQGLKEATARDDPHNAAALLDHVALVEKALGRYDEAIRMSLQSLAAHRRIGDVAGEALCLNNVATAHLARQDYASAGTYLREGLALCDRESIASTRVYILANLTEVALKGGDTAAAEGFAQRGIDLATAVGNRAVVAWLKLQFVRLALLRGDLPAARAELAGSLAISAALAQAALKIGAVIIFAEVLAAQGEVARARQVFAFAATHPSTSMPDRDEIREQLAQLPAATGTEPAWPGIALDDLVERIVGEADVAYAPLIAALRAAP